MIGSESKGECLSPEDIGLVTPERVGGDRRQDDRSTALHDGKEFHGRRAAQKAAGIFREEGRADLHAVASLNEGELTESALLNRL